MDENEILDQFASAVKRELVVDLIDRVPQEAFRAHEMVKTQSGLTGRSARELTGQARFRMMERGFVEENAKHGGIRLHDDVIPGTDIQVFQPFFIHGEGEKRVVLGLATIAEPAKLPTQNRSRAAAVQLNYRVLPTLDFDGTAPKAGDIFVLLLVARDPEHGGMIKELAIGVIDASFKQYIVYATIEKLMAHYTSLKPGVAPTAPLPTGGMKLKAQPKTFSASGGSSETSHRGSGKR